MDEGHIKPLDGRPGTPQERQERFSGRKKDKQQNQNHEQNADAPQKTQGSMLREQDGHDHNNKPETP